IDDDSLTSTNDQRHAPAWLFSSNTRQLSTGGAGTGPLLPAPAGSAYRRRTASLLQLSGPTAQPGAGQLPVVLERRSLFVLASLEVAVVRCPTDCAQTAPAHSRATDASGSAANPSSLCQPQAPDVAGDNLWLWSTGQRSRSTQGSEHRRRTACAAHRASQGCQGSAGDYFTCIAVAPAPLLVAVSAREVAIPAPVQAEPASQHRSGATGFYPG